MKNRQKKVLPFPKPPEGPVTSTIIAQIGRERFAIHLEIEDLPPEATVALEREGQEGSPQDREIIAAAPRSSTYSRTCYSRTRRGDQCVDPKEWLKTTCRWKQKFLWLRTHVERRLAVRTTGKCAGWEAGADIDCIVW